MGKTDTYEQLQEMMSATIQELLAAKADSEAKAQKKLEEAMKKISDLKIENKRLKEEAKSHAEYHKYFV